MDLRTLRLSVFAAMIAALFLVAISIGCSSATPVADEVVADEQDDREEVIIECVVDVANAVAVHLSSAVERIYAALDDSGEPHSFVLNRGEEAIHIDVKFDDIDGTDVINDALVVELPAFSKEILADGTVRLNSSVEVIHSLAREEVFVAMQSRIDSIGIENAEMIRRGTVDIVLTLSGAEIGDADEIDQIMDDVSRLDNEGAPPERTSHLPIDCTYTADRK